MPVMMSLRFHANDLIRNAFENAFEKKWQGQFLGLWNIWIKQPFKIRFFCNN